MTIPRAVYPAPFNITRASHVVLTVKDLGASRAFYVDALGFAVSDEDANTLYLITRSRNTAGGYIEGIELNWQQGFSFLPAPFDKMGTLVNYTYVDSSVLYYLSSGTATTPTFGSMVANG